MKNRYQTIKLLILFLFVSYAGFSQNLISANDLSKIMNQKDVVVVSARPASDYAKVHIRGAVNVDVSTLHQKEPIEGMLKSTDEIATILGEHGISPEKKIVLYCKSGVNAGRLYWILKYMGCNDVSMLDGHMGAWRAARKPVTGSPTPIKTETFIAQINSSILATKKEVNSKINNPSSSIVDCRKDEDYEQAHINNAVHINYKELMSEHYVLKTNAEIKTILETAGITKDKEIILYCKTGTVAGLLYYILSGPMEYPNVKLYDGSYNEWSQI